MTKQELDAIREEHTEAKVAYEALDNDPECEDTYTKVTDRFESYAGTYVGQLLEEVDRLRESALETFTGEFHEALEEAGMTFKEFERFALAQISSAKKAKEAAGIWMPTND